MTHRRKAGKPRVALWMLVAFGDAVLLLASIGISLMVALLGVVTVTVGALGGWLLLRRSTPVRDAVSAPVAVPVTTRRRA